VLLLMVLLLVVLLRLLLLLRPINIKSNFNDINVIPLASWSR